METNNIQFSQALAQLHVPMPVSCRQPFYAHARPGVTARETDRTTVAALL